MTARPPTSPAAPAPAGRSAARRHQLPGSPAKALPYHHSAELARLATLRLALRKPVPKPIPPTSSATLRIAGSDGLWEAVYLWYVTVRDETVGTSRIGQLLSAQAR